MAAVSVQSAAVKSVRGAKALIGRSTLQGVSAHYRELAHREPHMEHSQHSTGRLSTPRSWRCAPLTAGRRRRGDPLPSSSSLVRVGVGMRVKVKIAWRVVRARVRVQQVRRWAHCRG
eukprot:scaffold3825_cov62-Phaeocystis_antarctica.AAC.2